MAALEWHSESREWYRAAVLVLGMMLASRAIVRNAVEGPLLAELNLDLLFLLIALPGFWLGVQGYRLREGRGALLKARGEDIDGKTCTISGSGNVAQFCAEKVISYGGKVLTMSDSGGFVHDPDGIDAEKLAWVMELKNNRRGRISEYAKKFKSASYYTGKRPWSVACDIALPCATQNEIEKAGAKALVKGGTIAVCEGANMPTTPEAVEIFQAAKIAFGPAKAANAGGVAVSALEMAQNAYFSEWSREEVDGRLDSIMTGIHAQCDAAAEKYGHAGDLLVGANVSGFLKVANAMLDQGVV